MLSYLSEQHREKITKSFSLPTPLKVTNFLKQVAGRKELYTSREGTRYAFRLLLPPSDEPLIRIVQVKICYYEKYVLSDEGKLYVQYVGTDFEPLPIPEKIAKFYHHSNLFLMLGVEGKVWALDKKVVVPINFPEPISSIFDRSSKKIYFVTATGKLYKLSKLSHFYTINRWSPTRAKGPLKKVGIVSVSSTYYHSLFLSDQGVVYHKYKDALTLVVLPEPIIKIATCDSAALLVTKSGVAYKFKCGDGVKLVTELDGVVADACVMDTCAALLMSDGRLYLTRIDSTGGIAEFEREPKLGFAKIGCDRKTIILLSRIGKLYAFGLNYYGKLGHRGPDTFYWCARIDFKQAIVDLDTTDGVVIESDGKIYCTIPGFWAR